MRSSHKKIWRDRFSRFDVYWIQTNKQTKEHHDKKAIYIDGVRTQKLSGSLGLGKVPLSVEPVNEWKNH